MYLFGNPHALVRQPTGLTDEHLVLASQDGDVQTLVKLPTYHEESLNYLCVRNMHSALKRKFADLVLAQGVTDLKIRLFVAVAFAFHKKIVWWHGNRCVNCHTEWSVCYQEKEQDSFFGFPLIS